MTRPKPSKAPCGTCPYRTGVPSGVWEASEYQKLLAYDGETWEQAMKGATALFYCHQNDGHLCAGWVGCHDTGHLLAMRLHDVHPNCFTYESPVQLFKSGAEAAAHGLRDVANPGPEAEEAMRKLLHKRELEGNRAKPRET